MKDLYVALIFSLFFSIAGTAQSDLTIFSDAGEKFIASVNGKIFNDEPLSRVECKGLTGESQRVSIQFEDENIADIRKNMLTESGLQYTITIKKNKKGAYVLRPLDMGTPIAKSEGTQIPDPSRFEETEVVATGSQVTGKTGNAEVGSSIQVVETTTTNTEGDNMNVSMELNGVAVKLNMNDGMESSQTTTSTTTTTTTSNTNIQQLEVAEVNEEGTAGYVLPGYSGAIGCDHPMSNTEYEDAISSISSKSFADSKMTLAKQIAKSKCFLTDQVKGIMGEFDFEDDKLEFAKYAYDRTYDIDDYYKVNDAFTFETTIDELNEFLEGR